MRALRSQACACGGVQPRTRARMSACGAPALLAAQARAHAARKSAATEAPRVCCPPAGGGIWQERDCKELFAPAHWNQVSPAGSSTRAFFSVPSTTTASPVPPSVSAPVTLARCTCACGCCAHAHMRMRAAPVYATARMLARGQRLRAHPLFDARACYMRAHALTPADIRSRMHTYMQACRQAMRMRAGRQCACG